MYSVWDLGLRICDLSENDINSILGAVPVKVPESHVSFD